MRPLLLAIAVSAVAGVCSAQIGPPSGRQGSGSQSRGGGFGGQEGPSGLIPPASSLRPIRIAVRSADPYTIVALLQGTPIVSPEMSTILGFAGMPQQATNALNGFFASGKFMVNPTDNSIWWLPGQ